MAEASHIVAAVVVRHIAYVAEVGAEVERKRIHTDSEEGRTSDFVVAEMDSQGRLQVVVEHTHEEPVVEDEVEENMSNLAQGVPVEPERGNCILLITVSTASVEAAAELEEAVYRN